MNAKEAHELLQTHQGIGVLDIRTPEEFQQGHIPGALNIDFHAENFEKEIAKLDREKSYLLYCRSGRRSAHSLDLFKSLGFKEIFHLHTGILDWQAQKLPVTK